MLCNGSNLSASLLALVHISPASLGVHPNHCTQASNSMLCPFHCHLRSLQVCEGWKALLIAQIRETAVFFRFMELRFGV